MKSKRKHEEVCGGVGSDVPDTDGDHDVARLAFRLIVLWGCGEDAGEEESIILGDYSKEASEVYGGIIRPYVARMFTARGVDLHDVIKSNDVNAVRGALGRVVGTQFTHPVSSAAVRRGPYRCSVCKAFKKGGCLCSLQTCLEGVEKNNDLSDLGLII